MKKADAPSTEDAPAWLENGYVRTGV
jgi:hypothetical protein